jgi:uncharacterized protein with HEPN domain
MAGPNAPLRSPQVPSVRKPSPWREIIGTRNRLTYGYDAVDCDILWEILTADFPAVADLIRPIIAAEE